MRVLNGRSSENKSNVLGKRISYGSELSFDKINKGSDSPELQFAFATDKPCAPKDFTPFPVVKRLDMQHGAILLADDIPRDQRVISHALPHHADAGLAVAHAHSHLIGTLPKIQTPPGVDVVMQRRIGVIDDAKAMRQ